MGATEIALDSLPQFRLARSHRPRAYHGIGTPKLFEHTCPFRFSLRLRIGGRTEQWGEWWATKDLNLGPLPCEGSALTTELVAHAVRQFRGRTEFPEKSGSKGRRGCSRNLHGHLPKQRQPIFVAEGHANCKQPRATPARASPNFCTRSRAW